MIADNDLLTAIDELTLLAELEPDPSLDIRLVQLRNQAFSVLDEAPGREQWPPQYADPFADETGIPTVAASGLDVDVIGGGITHHGCLRVNGLLDPSTVSQLRDLIDSAFDDRARAGRDASPSGAGDYVPFTGSKIEAEGFANRVFMRMSDVPVAMRTVAGIFARSGLSRHVTDYFQERPAMIADKWVLRRSPKGGMATDYHQDGAFLGEDIRTMNCWIALSDCGPGTGRPSMDLIPRRFPLLNAGDGAIFNWSLNADKVEASVPDAMVVTPTFAAGDALIFDERLPHRTQFGPELGSRYAIESWFVAPSSYPHKSLPFVL